MTKKFEIVYRDPADLIPYEMNAKKHDEQQIRDLAAAIKKTQKRANALKNIVIPRYTALVKSISESLEEKDIEEFSRMKTIKNYKLKKSGRA